MENELLKNESIAGVKSILDYAQVKYDKNFDNYQKEAYYWEDVVKSCKQELESRITKIFPR